MPAPQIRKRKRTLEMDEISKSAFFALDKAVTDEIESIIGYVFRDKNLLITAFTHASYCNEHRGTVSYDRLEFFGDSILGFLMAQRLYFGTDKSEGEMTKLRASSVSEEPLAAEIDRLGLMKYLRHGKSLNEDEALKAKSDLFESILGAIYIDSGNSLEAPKRLVDSLPIVAVVDYKSALNEYALAKKKELSYVTIKDVNENGEFISHVVFDGVSYDCGFGKKKVKAEQKAAENAYKKLVSD